MHRALFRCSRLAALTRPQHAHAQTSWTSVTSLRAMSSDEGKQGDGGAKNSNGKETLSFSFSVAAGIPSRSVQMVS